MAFFLEVMKYSLIQGDSEGKSLGSAYQISTMTYNGVLNPRAKVIPPVLKLFNPLPPT